jgi:hypothetical protein
MSDVAAIVADLVREGVSAELVGRVAAALAERPPVVVELKDEQAERRRAADRDRKRAEKETRSAEFRGTSAECEQKKVPPDPLKENTPHPYGMPTPNGNGELLEAFTEWNNLAERTGLAKVQKLTKPRATHLRARLGEGGLDGWRKTLGRIETCTFLRGDNDRGWRADYDFVVSERGYVKINEGKYERPGAKQIDYSF